MVTLSKSEYCRVAEGHAQGHRHHHDDGELDDVQEEGDGQALGDLVQNRPAIRGERAAEVQSRHAGEPVPVLNGQRPVQAELLAQELAHLGRALGGGVARLQICRLAGRQMNDEKGHERDADEEGQREERAAQGVGEHERLF